MKKFGLVLGGGGARGAYQVGALKALQEIGYKAQVVTGTSIGAINATTYAQKRIDLLENVWNTISFEKVVDHKFKCKNKSLELLFCAPFCGGFSTKPLEKLLNKFVNEKEVRNSDINFGLVYTRPGRKYTPVRISDIPEGELVKHLLTSASAIPFLKKQVLNGKKCYDGFYSDNLPLRLASEMGANKIIAIDILSGFGKKLKDKSVEVLTIKPSKGLGFFLNFDPAKIAKNMELGYQDVMNKKDEILKFMNS